VKLNEFNLLRIMSLGGPYLLLKKMTHDDDDDCDVDLLIFVTDN